MTTNNYKIMDYKRLKDYRILAINLLFYKHSNNINKKNTRTYTRTHNADTSNCNYMCNNDS